MKKKWPRRLRIAPRGTVRQSTGGHGFTLIEALAALSISALAFSAASLVFQSITSNNKRLSSVVTVTFPDNTVLTNLYDLPQSSINVYATPNYGRMARSDELRGRFYEDVERASAIFCLGRNKLNTVRPSPHPDEAINFPAGTPMLDTPEAFRQHLIAMIPDAGLIFENAPAYFNVAGDASSGTIFMFRQNNDESLLNTLAIYEIDLIVPSSPAGTYVSVRRYAPDQAVASLPMRLTNYYDCFYGQVDNEVLFRPLFVSFERRSRLSIVEDDDIAAERNWADRFKVAENRPFYFMWWPDPGASSMRVDELPAALPASNPVSEYAWMGGRTSYMFVFPMFPAF